MASNYLVVVCAEAAEEVEEVEEDVGALDAGGEPTFLVAGSPVLVFHSAPNRHEETDRRFGRTQL